MRTLALILVTLTLLGAVIARPLSAETTEVVLLGRSDLLAQNVPQRHITRIERFVPPVSADATNPALSSLDDAQAPLLAAIPKVQTVWEPLVGPPRPSEPRQELVGTLAPRQDPLIGEDISAAMFETQPQPLEAVLANWAPLALLGMVLLTFRKWILAAINRIMLMLVVAVHRPDAQIDYNSSGSRRRRRRSRHRAMDVSWYFRAAGSSRRRRRRRWSSSYRPREYVVTDVVYATAPAQQYLLTHTAS